jgi:hypothetical protein
LDQKSRQNDATSFSCDGERQRTTCLVGEQHRSFGEADYFLVDRGIGGLAISKRTRQRTKQATIADQCSLRPVIGIAREFGA